MPEPRRAQDRDDLAARVDDVLRLACLTYDRDSPERRAQAEEALAREPALGRATIHVAAAAGDVACVTALLAADPARAREPGGPHGWEPLLYLAYSRLDASLPGRDPVQVARLLLDHGADPNAGFLWSGDHVPPFTVLTGAFGGGEDAPNQPPHPCGDALARLLLERGADPNDGQALYNRHFGATDDHLELLLAHGLGRGGGGPWYRRLGDRLATPRQLLEDQLLFAAANDRPARVELLLAHGVAPDGAGTGHPILHGRRAIELAAAHGATRIVEVLLQAGAKPAVQDDVAAFLGACLAGDRPRVAAALADDPTLRARAIARSPAGVRRAADLRRDGAVRLLVELGWQVDAGSGHTALHGAAYAGERDLVETLLALGADPTVRDASFGAPPSGWAEHAGNHALAARLRAAEEARGA